MTRVVVIGDVHLRSAHPRNRHRLSSLDQALATGLGLEQLGAWVILGDVFDSTSAIEDRNDFAERLVLMAGRAPVIVVRGNHDAHGDLSIFGRLASVWPIVVRETPDVVSVMFATGESASIFVLPWPEEGGLVSAGVAPSDLTAAGRVALDAVFMDAADKLADARRRGDLTLFAGHVTVAGAIASTGQPQMNTGPELDAALLARLGDCPKVTGHIHKPQEVAGAIYAGSVARTDLGEVEDKRFLVVEFAAASDWTVRSYPLNCPAIWHVETTFVKDQPFAYVWKAGPEGEPLEPPASLKGAEVRCRVRFAQSERTFYEMAKPQLLADFADAKLTIDPVCVPDRGMRAPEVAAARTLREKVEAYAKVTGTALPEAVLAKLDLLDRASAADVQAEVEREIAALLATADDERTAAVA